MNLLVTLDENYYPQLQVMLSSLRINNPGERFSLYLFHSGLTEQILEQIDKWCKSAGYDFSPARMDGELFRGFPQNDRYPIEMYYRLLAPQLLPSNMEKVLYLDPDILIINPISRLWESDLGDHLFAAAAHTGKTELANDVNRIRLGVEHDYYNSGVLLINLDMGRKMIDPDQIFQYIKEHRKELVLPDQDVLNAMYGDRILPLDDAIWNYDARNYNNYFLRSSGTYDLQWVMEHTSVLHFCGKAKPWKPPYFYRFGVLYYHYEQLSRRLWTKEN